MQVSKYFYLLIVFLQINSPSVNSNFTALFLGFISCLIAFQVPLIVQVITPVDEFEKCILDTEKTLFASFNEERFINFNQLFIFNTQVNE